MSVCCFALLFIDLFCKQVRSKQVGSVLIFFTLFFLSNASYDSTCACCYVACCSTLQVKQHWLYAGILRQESPSIQPGLGAPKFLTFFVSVSLTDKAFLACYCDVREILLVHWLVDYVVVSYWLRKLKRAALHQVCELLFFVLFLFFAHCPCHKCPLCLILAETHL